jgi:2-polyprenyl-3-methyl-5-hydroxy-6-metoxy-1,4-benzoquinol methylase
MSLQNENNDTRAIKLEKVICPRCASAESNVVIKGTDFIYGVPGEFYGSECTQCHLWFQNPRPIAADIHKLYPATYSPHAAINRAPVKRLSPGKLRYLRRSLYYTHLPQETGSIDLTNLPFLNKFHFGVNLVPSFVEKGKLLEIGCANGERLMELRNLGWQNLYGIELMPEAVAIARNEGFSVECGQIEETIENYPNNYFDVIITSMVVEHLFNPFDIFHRISRKLKPGGQLLFSTVVRDSLDGKFFKQFWAGFDFPRHMVFFKKNDLLSTLVNDFDHIESFHQNAPIDFKRSTALKIGLKKGTLLDKMILALAQSRIANQIGRPLAWLGLTTRISVRCTKKILS